MPVNGLVHHTVECPGTSVINGDADANVVPWSEIVNHAANFGAWQVVFTKFFYCEEIKPTVRLDGI